MSNNLFKIREYPEETSQYNVDGHAVKMDFYGEKSEQEHMAMISHFFHNQEIATYAEKAEAEIYLREYIQSMSPNVSKDEMDMLCENPLQLELFREWQDVPFHTAKDIRFKFIDLFAGIGGIRIPFTELGGKCVFSSEWDTAACRTYTGNFG